VTRTREAGTAPADASALSVPANASHPPEAVVILAEVRALESRLARRPPKVTREVLTLLQGAVDVAFAGDPVLARATLEKAEAVYHRDVQTTNRLQYVLGVVLGLAVTMLVTLGVVALADRRVANLATSDVIVSLFAFAGVGSLVSVMTRLSSIDLRAETSKSLVMLSAGSRPLVAVAFASIVYIVLKAGIVNISLGTGDGADNAVFWIAAFLCGYSERFATDVLARLPIGGSPAP
jgi:ABC-type transport system involved in cytochrome bd biosynthesis fused ATPase/permease subunit